MKQLRLVGAALAAVAVLAVDALGAASSVKRLISGRASRPSGHDWNPWSAHADHSC
jgi:hypothetical protein